MSAESVKAWLAANAPDLPIIEVEGTTATVATAADALGVQPGRIAKTLAVRAGDHTFLLVTRGDSRLDNRKCKDEFGRAVDLLERQHDNAVLARFYALFPYLFSAKRILEAL